MGLGFLVSEKSQEWQEGIVCYVTGHNRELTLPLKFLYLDLGFPHATPHLGVIFQLTLVSGIIMLFKRSWVLVWCFILRKSTPL